jgi:DNA-binding CsgD family transcriptional regulator
MLPRHPVPVTTLDRQTAVDPLSIEVADELCAQLRSLAFAEGQSPEVLGQRLLARALEQETRRARAERTLARLTVRQQEVARLAADGSTNRQIAERLVVSTETVKTHIANVLERLGLRSKAELRLLLLELGLPPKPERPGAPGIHSPFRLPPLAAHREQVRRTIPGSDPDRRHAGEASASRRTTT